MKLHTRLIEQEVGHALTQAFLDGKVSGGLYFRGFEQVGSRSHDRAFNFYIGANDDLHRRKTNSGTHGAGSYYAATYDEWGWFIAYVFALDPNAKFGPYKGVDDFTRQTDSKFTV